MRASPAVTIATNMAGRGTDIKLGGNVDFLIMEALAKDPEGDPEAIREAIEADHQKAEQAVKEAGASSFWQPDGMKAAGLTTSCAAVQAGKGIRGARSSSCPSRTI